jgi:predicted Zn-dependent peptidase
LTIFKRTRLNNGINLFIHPTGKFKTVLVQLIFHRHLRAEDVTDCSLLPSVLQRGSNMYPTRQQLAYKLEELYGSELMADVSKKGERLFVTFTMDLVHDQYLPGENELLRKGLAILKDLISDPVLEGNGFKSDYVTQEKEQHEKVIKGLINDKIAYSVERCLREMCKDEPFGVFKYGDVEKLRQIDNKSLYRFYRDFLTESPVDLHIIGDVDPERVAALVDEVLQFDRGTEMTIPATVIKGDNGEVKYVSEKLDVSQGKLVLGYRTGLTYADDDYFPLLMYNGILGSFPHSKLFQNVREKASLAYYAYSRLEKHKGLMIVSAGIEDKNYQQTLEIIEKQIEDMRKGDFGPEEYENTQSGLRNQFMVEEDNPALVINRALDGMLSGRVEDTGQLLERLAAVTREDVARVADNIKLDTVFFLSNKGVNRHEQNC